MRLFKNSLLLNFNEMLSNIKKYVYIEVINAAAITFDTLEDINVLKFKLFIQGFAVEFYIAQALVLRF